MKKNRKLKEVVIFGSQCDILEREKVEKFVLLTHWLEDGREVGLAEGEGGPWRPDLQNF